MRETCSSIRNLCDMRSRSSCAMLLEEAPADDEAWGTCLGKAMMSRESRLDEFIVYFS